MINTDLKSNTEFDERYNKLKSVLEHSHVPDNFDFIYDASKRLMNQHGLEAIFISYLYTMGFVDGKKAERSRKNNINPKTENHKKEQETEEHSYRRVLIDDIEVMIQDLSTHNLALLKACAVGLHKNGYQRNT